MSPNSVDIWLPLYCRDFLADTQKMSNELVGIYTKLLVRYWLDDGRLLNDDEELARVAGLQFKQLEKIKPKLMHLFRVEGNCLISIRLESALVEARERRLKKKHAANERWIKERSKQ